MVCDADARFVIALDVDAISRAKQAAGADAGVMALAESDDATNLALLADVEAIVRDIVPGGYRFYVRVYGLNGVVAWPTPPANPPREVFVLAECVAETAEEARTATAVFKQYLLHHGFPGRISTGGNIAFPFTPPELDAGTAYRFVIYHLMEVDDPSILFPIEVEQL